MILESVLIRNNTLKNKYSSPSVMDMFDPNQGGAQPELKIDKIDEEEEESQSSH